MEFVKRDNAVPESRTESRRIRFEISIDKFQEDHRFRVEPHRDGDWIAWHNGDIIHIGEREDCIKALRERGVNYNE